MSKNKNNTLVSQKNTNSTKPLIMGSKLSQLGGGLLVLNIQKEIEESAYTAMDRITKNRRVVSRRQEYCSDLERVIDEAKLTTHLLSEIKQEIKIGDKIYQPEEVISYYNGIFLDQVHQIKDKLFRMIALLLLVPETAQDNQKKDPKEIKYQSFMNKNVAELKKIGIFDLLSQWGSGNLAVALDKRTQHHHFVSTLRLNEDFQKIKMSRIMLNPLTSNQLSEYGKKRMAQIGEESFKKWREEIVKKQQNTIDEIEQNIEQVAEKLISHFNIPVKPEESAAIVNKYTDFLASFDIHNQASINKVSPELKELIDGFLKIGQEMLGNKLLSVYLVGSCARGEFAPGSSDINLYFIIENESDLSITRNEHLLLNAVFITRKAFMSESHKKDRFICWSDGVLLYREEFKIDEKEFPKPGSLLCLLLNRGFIEKLEKIKKEVATLTNPDKKILRKYSLDAVKIMLDFDFGVAISNKPFYTASRKEKINYTKELFPDERRTTTLEQIYQKGVIRKKDFPILIDTYLEKAKINYQKLLNVEKEILLDGSN